ncbi:MmcQ/YjbR family DNA-binding protein [Zeaxanthinibacter enoshimensis]|uniref:YjbR protein n=1 Tax=Zeaxanthinibacter enoshimensis TaxID=392009 RepID=A0A4R6TR86_9FLAO|nr:MmcQ/YjbR family DNA-binding protein [Zeaxanthinibacter enoshimensis]TDQ33026.1 YjbR protein [Zeaxanthinibacter enoshimensis]
MEKSNRFRELALSFPNSEERPHFERMGYRITGKRMFATFLPKDETANIFLTPEEQTVFCRIDPGNIYPVPNKWGEKGATTFVVNNLSEKIVLEALLSAYNQVLKPKP